MICASLHLIFIFLPSFLQSEMKLFGGFDTVALKQHFGKKIMELEDEKRTVQVNLKTFELTGFIS